MLMTWTNLLHELTHRSTAWFSEISRKPGTSSYYICLSVIYQLRTSWPQGVTGSPGPFFGHPYMWCPLDRKRC